MLRLLADENFNGDIVRGLFLRKPGVNVVRIQDLELDGATDPEVLAWAAENDYIVLTHDRATMPGFAVERTAGGLKMPGIFVIHDRFPVGSAIDELLLVEECSAPTDWDGLVVFLPL